MLKFQQLAEDAELDVKLTKMLTDHADGGHHVNAFFVLKGRVR
jgi:hypothetical protein